MRTLLISIGNSLRRDDGAAHELLRLVSPAPDRESRAVQQLTPELAAEFGGFDHVVFLDADIKCDHLVVEPVPERISGSPPLTHVANPADIVAIARALYGFDGKALLCRIPAGDF